MQQKKTLFKVSSWKHGALALATLWAPSVQKLSLYEKGKKF